jgi:hypothetical protein
MSAALIYYCSSSFACAEVTREFSSYDYISVLMLLYVSSYYYIHVSFPHTTTEVSSYYYMCPHTTVYTSVFLTSGFLILLHYCPNTTALLSCITVLILLYTRQFSSRQVFSYYCITVVMLLYMCPHTTNVHCMCPRTSLYKCPMPLYMCPPATVNTHTSIYIQVSSCYSTCALILRAFCYIHRRTWSL